LLGSVEEYLFGWPIFSKHRLNFIQKRL